MATQPPAPVDAPTTAAASALANFLAQEALAAHATPEPAIEVAPEVEEIDDLAHPVIPTDTGWDLEPEIDLEPTPAPITAPIDRELDLPIDDLAHPVIPTDTGWDLEPEIDLEPTPAPITAPIDRELDPPIDDLAPTSTADPAVAEPAVIAHDPVVPDTTPTPIAVVPSPPMDSPAATEAVQPTLAAAALTPAVPPPTTTPPPAAPRQPGGRRKAQAPKAGLSRLLPNRPARASGRFSRKTSGGDADASPGV